MKSRIFLTCLWILAPVMLSAQGYRLLPSQLPDYLYGTWTGNSSQNSLIITSDYLVLHNELFYYEDIVQQPNEIRISCWYQDDKKDIVISGLTTDNLFLDEGTKISTLTKSYTENLKNIPESLTDVWYDKTSSITLKADEVQFAEDIFPVDYVATSDQLNYTVVLYRKGNYLVLYNTIADTDQYLNVGFMEPLVFKKATFFQKNKNVLIILGVLLLMLISYLLVRWQMAVARKKEQSKRLFTEMQLKSFRSQMNPHFLFNALSAIQNLINQGDNDKANHYLTEFSQLMRLTLDKTESGLVSLSDEIESIRKYLEIEKLRLEFEYQISIDETINQDELEIPAMLVQPFVENAIIHGLKEIDANRTLAVVFKADDKNLVCIVTDNGIGVNASKANKQTDLNRNKYGLKLAEDRIRLINETYNTNAKISITDRYELNANETGTEVKIIMPLRY